MKNIFTLILCAVLLCGCSGQTSSIEDAISLRQKIAKSKGCSFLCSITADYGEELHTFTLSCQLEDGGKLSFSVAQPDSIKGITGYIEGGEGKLTFDHKVLAFSLLADGYISPISAPWLMINGLKGGYIQSCEQVDSGKRITINDTFSDQPIQIDVWIDSSGVPYQSEILWQGKRILSLEISDFSFV